MKKIIVLASVLFTAVTANSQEVPDALRYAQTNLQGTARFSALSGAFGALGGDFSALNVNPAGSAIFSNNQAGGTLSNSNTSNNSEYFGTNKKSKENSFDLNQAGGVFVFEDHSGKSDWKKFAIALNYENTNNFDNSYVNSGTNPNNSIANYFLSYANPDPRSNQAVIPLNLVENGFYDDLNFADQQAFLGYQGYVINPNNTTNTSFYVANNPGGNYAQENSFVSTGYNGKLTFNGAASYKDKLLIGVNFNSHFSDYRQTTRFQESNNNSGTTGLRNLTFSNDLYTYGSGFSMNLGAIVKINKEIRAGLAWESPTWYTLNDELKQDLITTGFNYLDSNKVPIIGLSDANPDSNVTIKYAPYKLQTPSKVTGSFAYVFGKKGLISIDYAIKDYSNTKFKDNDEGSIRINQTMTEILDKTEEVRIGAEYRFKQFSFRAGHRREQSPYKNNWTVGNLRGYSAGVGYNFGDTKLDISYNRSERTTNQGFFQQGFTDGAKIKSINNNISLTLLFEL
jgi:Uncharacterised protein family (UPF0164)